MQSTFASELVKVHLRFTGRSSLNPARDHGTIAATAAAMPHEAAPGRASMTSTAKRAICPAAAGGLARTCRRYPSLQAVLEWQRNVRNQLRRRNWRDVAFGRRVKQGFFAYRRIFAVRTSWNFSVIHRPWKSVCDSDIKGSVSSGGWLEVGAVLLRRSGSFDFAADHGPGCACRRRLETRAGTLSTVLPRVPRSGRQGWRQGIHAPRRPARSAGLHRELARRVPRCSDNRRGRLRWQERFHAVLEVDPVGAGYRRRHRLHSYLAGRVSHLLA
jgi:hypothetical protein